MDRTVRFREYLADCRRAVGFAQPWAESGRLTLRGGPGDGSGRPAAAHRQPASRPVPAIIFHGTADPIVSFEGGPSRDFDVPFPAIPDWVATLAQRSGCQDAPLDLLTSGSVSGVHYAGCADVVFYTIAGGGHSWPGGNPLPGWIVGITTQDIDATRTMWAFFQQHPLPENKPE